MTDDDDRIFTEATAWNIASGSDDMDWDAFTAWLDADARHARIYDEVALLDSMLGDHRMELLAVDQAPPVATMPGRSIAVRRKWGGWAGLAVAASLAAVLLAPRFHEPSTVYETQARSRQIALDNGIAVTLAPHSRLAISGRDGDRLALTGGGWFDVRHNSDRMLTIQAGQLEIRDIGTRFDVQAQPANVRVSVVEGQVSVTSQSLSQPIRLERGRSLSFDSGEGVAIVKSLAVADIGAWRSGRLFYEDASLPLVLDDLSRYAGVHVTLPESLRSRQFTGSLIVKDGEAAIRDLAEVMDLELRRNGDGFSLRERRR